MELTDQTLYSMSSVIVDDILELNVVESVKTEKGDFKVRAKDAVKVSRCILRKVNPNFL